MLLPLVEDGSRFLDCCGTLCASHIVCSCTLETGSLVGMPAPCMCAPVAGRAVSFFGMSAVTLPGGAAALPLHTNSFFGTRDPLASKSVMFHNRHTHTTNSPGCPMTAAQVQSAAAALSAHRLLLETITPTQPAKTLTVSTREYCKPPTTDTHTFKAHKGRFTLSC